MPLFKLPLHRTVSRICGLTLSAMLLAAGSVSAYTPGLTDGEVPGGNTLGGLFKVLVNGQDYTLDQSYSNAALVVIGGRYSTSIADTGIDGNSFTMDGSAYSINFNSTSILQVGYAGGDDNTMTMKNGASLTVASNIGIGNEGSLNNKLVVDGSTTAVSSDYLDVGYSSSSASVGNSLVIRNGAKVVCSCAAYDSTIGYFAGSNDNSVVVNGAGSSWMLGYSAGSGSVDSLAIGNSSTGNALSIENGGLVAIGNSNGGGLTIATGNYVQLANGLLAIYGSVDIATLLNGKIKVWDGTMYFAATSSDYSFSYCTNVGQVNTFLAAHSLSTYGYDAASLVNYTLVTGGVNVPEPATCALFGGIGALALIGIGKRKRVR
jgi:hypothetical protein